MRWMMISFCVGVAIGGVFFNGGIAIVVGLISAIAGGVAFIVSTEWRLHRLWREDDDEG